MTNAVISLVIAALVQVESGGRNVTGDGGRAVGVLQIWPITVREANRIAGRQEWTLSDRRNPAKSRAMAACILNYYHGRGVTDPVELAARWRNPHGNAPGWYRAKVENALRAQRETR